MDIASRGAALTEAVLTVGATCSLYPSLEKRFAEILRENADREERDRQRKKLFQTLYRLKKDGIVTQNAPGIFAVTERGRQILKLSSASSYCRRAISETIVIIFDIPESRREKRAWFREVITKLGFSMVQRSVWIGNTDIPEQLIHDLDSLSLTGYVEFFTVVKRGTLTGV